MLGRCGLLRNRPRTGESVFDYPPFNIVDATLYQALQDLLARMDASPSLRVRRFRKLRTPSFFLSTST